LRTASTQISARPGRSLIFQGRAGKFDGADRNVRRAHKSFLFFAAWIFYLLPSPSWPCFECEKNRTGILPRPYRCWGYPWVPGIFVAGALALTVNIWLERPRPLLSIGLLLILAGLPFLSLVEHVRFSS